MNAAERTHEIEQYYTLLEELEHRVGGRRLLKECTSRNWPKRGVYFFFEPEEHRTVSGSGPRVVRIGTHAVSEGSKATLWNRLSQHKGKTRDGGGNHRGSIFRRHVGTALLSRDGLTCETWGIGSRTTKEITLAEHQYEQLVSQALGQFSVLWLAVDDEPSKDSLRGFVERNAIALLSAVNDGTDPASDRWLGDWAKAPEIRLNGLWNVKHVDDTYDPEFLTVFRQLVQAQ